MPPFIVSVRIKGAGLLHPYRLLCFERGIAGAKSVLGVDASQLAVDQATENAKLNGLENTVSLMCRCLRVIAGAGSAGREI